MARDDASEGIFLVSAVVLARPHPKKSRVGIDLDRFYLSVQEAKKDDL